MVNGEESLFKRVAQLFATPAFDTQRVEQLVPMADGHAGHTFSLDLRDKAGRLTRHILKMGPPGVPRKGSADIFRQSALLKRLHAQGLPVPDIDWASAQEGALGAPFIIMRRLPGRSLIIWDPHPFFLAPGVDHCALWRDGARVLADIHRTEHRIHLADWEQDTSLASELDRWSSLIRHSEDSESRDLLGKLGQKLRAAMPSDEPIGLVHGDFQPGNILFQDGRISGVIDWDLAMIGPQGIDLGWYLMMADAACWDVAWRPVSSAPKEDLVRAYADAGGPALGHLDWYQAFAHFRFAAIAGLNLKLHRSGRRIDAIWERFAMSVPRLLSRGSELLHQGNLHD